MKRLLGACLVIATLLLMALALALALTDQGQPPWCRAGSAESLFTDCQPR